MRTKLLMTTSALFMAALGLASTFAPQETLALVGERAGVPTLLVQLAGALYLAFAMLNWMSRESVIGGIYNRPLALGNLLHFLVGAITLLKAVTLGPRAGWIMALAAVYSLFAVCFAGIVFLWSPVKARDA